MSKERLEAIRHYYREMESFDPGTQSDINWLIEQAERVQELERANKQLERQAPGVELELLNMELTDALKQNKRYREALEEIMKIQENHEWNLYGIAYGMAERTLFEVEGDLEWRKK